jgi:SAM-dependent methyltransferase
MTSFELIYLCAEPFLLPLHTQVRRQLRRIVNASSQHPTILDVGGRKSHYTVGISASITVTDLPRESDIQTALHLGIDEEIIEECYRRRSNIKSVLYDDMTHSSLPDCSFDCVVSVEVLEHVDEDALFVWNVSRILKANGVFLMTTPNGDAVKNTNPDHKRHYTQEQLRSLLSQYFGSVHIEYAIQNGLFGEQGLRSWSIKRPLGTLIGMTSNLINLVQSSFPNLKHDMHSTRHLIAVAGKCSRHAEGSGGCSDRSRVGAMLKGISEQSTTVH